MKILFLPTRVYVQRMSKRPCHESKCQRQTWVLTLSNNSKFGKEIYKWGMPMSALKALNPFKESFYGKWKKKKVINILTTFFISHKSDIKTFLKLIIN